VSDDKSKFYDDDARIRDAVSSTPTDMATLNWEEKKL
jgi:hypothetical protein